MGKDARGRCVRSFLLVEGSHRSLFSKRVILRSLAATAFSDALSRGFFFLFNVVVARTIEPLEFGVYGLAISLGVWLWSIADAGLTGHGTRLLAQGTDMGKTISAVLIARLPVLIALFTIFSAILLFLPLSANERLIYSTAIIYVLGMSIFPAWIARSQHANKEYMLAYGAVASSGVIFLIVFLIGIVPQNGITASFARTLSWLFGGIVAFYLIVKRMNFKLEWCPQKKILRQTMPLGVAANIYNFIPLIPFGAVRIIGKENDLAAFSVMMQAQMILLAGARVFSSVLMPSYVKQIQNRSKDHRFIWKIKYFALLFFVIFPVFLIYAIWGHDLIKIVFGNGYKGIDGYLLSFALAFLFSGLRYSCDSILIASGNYRIMVITGITVVLLSIFFSYLAKQFLFKFGWVLFLTECSLMIMNGVCVFLED